MGSRRSTAIQLSDACANDAFAVGQLRTVAQSNGLKQFDKSGALVIGKRWGACQYTLYVAGYFLCREVAAGSFYSFGVTVGASAAATMGYGELAMGFG